METLEQLVQDVSNLLAMSPADLAPYLLRLAKQRLQGGSGWPAFHIEGVAGSRSYGGTYSPARMAEVDIALAEGWNWLRVNSLIVPAFGQAHGWMMITRMGMKLADGNDQDFRRFRDATAFPKSLLHATLSDKAYLQLARGELDEAVFGAFKAVEVAVREAGGFGPKDIGPDLMRKAFDPSKGPLTDMTQIEAEREALSHLFAGAIGSYKNPHSHRTVNLQDIKEAQEMLVLASHLLGIVDARRRK